MLATPSNFLKIPDNLSDVPNASAARANLGLGTAATANTGTANGNVPVISGGTIPASIIPTLNQNTTGTAANLTGTVAIANGGTGAATASAALTNLGALPLTGGALSGAITGAGNLGTSAQGNQIAFEYIDNKGNVLLSFLSGGNLGIHPPKGIILLSNCPFYLDSAQVANIEGNGSGVISLTTVEAILAASPAGISSGTAVGNTIEAFFTNTGSAAQTVLALNFQGTAGSGTTKLLDCQLNGSPVGAYIDKGGNVYGNNFLTPSFDQAQLIIVDGTNGNDSSGSGTEVCPYQTIAHACSVATSGQAIFVKPGTYVLSGTNSAVNPPAGVAVIGAGRGVTVIQNHTDYNPVYAPNSNCLLANLTLDTADTSTAHHNGITVGLLSTQTTTPTNVLFENVDFISNYDGVNPTGGGGTAPFNWYFRGCRFHGACWMYWDQVGINSLFENCDWLGDGTITRSDGNPQYAAVVGTGVNSMATVVGGNINISDSTTASTLYANVAVVANGSTVRVAATNININCPNAASTANVAPFAWDTAISGSGATPTIQLGDGVTYSAYSYFGNASVMTMPPVQYVGGTQSLSVATSAVTPYFSKHRGEYLVAVDAGALTSNTLTINAPSNSAGDGSRFTLRIKNSNTGSTAMTLSFNSAYDNAAFTPGTIAAGKKIYLDYCYDADNSKWDLVGLAGGL